MPFKLHKSVAVLCIAVAVFATILSAVPLGEPALMLLAFWQIVPLVGAVIIRREDTSHHEQTSALLAFVPSRPPPSAARFA